MKKFSQLLGLFFAVIFVVTSVAVVSAEERVSASTCLDTGVGCKVGMTGPRGGTIFYDAGSQQWWGQFLEAENASTVAKGIWGDSNSIYGEPGNVAAQRQSMSIGMGRFNTAAMRNAGSPLAIGHTSADSDWYIPSKDELNELYDYRANQKTRLTALIPMWTSSESENSFAWYQLFHDGTQFTDANGILSELKTNKSYLRSAVHVGSGFLAAQMEVNRVRAFPYFGDQPPAFNLVTSTTENPQCVTLAMSCHIGDIGPGGGIVVYDAGWEQPWGRYLEVAPKSCEVKQVAFSTKPTQNLFPDYQRVNSKSIGFGKFNTNFLLTVSSPAALAATRTCNGLTDWFLPSKNELNEAFRWLSHGRKGINLTPVGGFERGYYWTSSDYNGSTAWTQYFADGQQFDRVQTLTGNTKPPARPFNVRPMRAFSEGQKTATKPIETTVPSITIVGSRTTVSGKPGVVVDGMTTGFAEGSLVSVYLRFPGEVEYTKGFAVITVGADGTFTWRRKTGKRISVYMKSEDGTLSNRITISTDQ
jgi:hypothetical protein